MTGGGSINTVVLAGDRNRCYRGLGNRSRSGHVCVFNTGRRGQQLRRGPLPGEQLWAKAVGVYCVDMSQSSGPAAMGRVMRAVPVWWCLFRGQQEVSN